MYRDNLYKITMIPGIIDIQINTVDAFVEAKICKNVPYKVF